MGAHVFPTSFPSRTPLPPPSHPIPLGHPSAPALSTLTHASNLERRSVSHMIICMFQCYSLKSSHPCLPPQSPKVYSGLLYCVSFVVSHIESSLRLSKFLICVLIYCIGVDLLYPFYHPPNYFHSSSHCTVLYVCF